MTTTDPGPEDVDARKLTLATAVAAVVATVVLVVAVLPAEYGLDPTGVGTLAGFTKLSGATTEGDAPATGPRDTGTNGTARNGTTRVAFTFDASWPVTRTTHPLIDGYTAEGDTTTVTVPVTRANVTAFTATLTWTDANETAGQRTDPDAFEIVIEAPDGTRSDALMARNAADGAGVLNVTLRLRDPPAPTFTEALSPDEARAHFMQGAPTDATGVGEWRVHVTLAEAGDARVGGLPVGSAGDAGNTWNLTTTVSAFALEFQSRPGSGVASDSRSFTLVPGEDLEFKLHMNEGDALEYDWSASGGSVYADFHGEPDGAAADVFTSHESGTFASSADAFEAPFTGRHGWYWRNDGASTVTITLDLRGTYEIVGIV